MRIVVGLSGGVDSAVAALLLREAGHTCIGLTLRTWEGRESRCCAIDAARETAAALGIEYRVLGCVSPFRERVEKPFLASYLSGETPNPCVWCNAEVKWTWLEYARELFQAEAVATGHYASVTRMENGRYAAARATDLRKDQSYMLCRLTQKQLAHTVLPLGALYKEEVRRLAREAGLPCAGARESQEICFIREGSYADYLEELAPGSIPGPGDFVDEAGTVLGRHRGYHRYTVGQRKGLHLALGEPYYVKAICPAENRVVLAPDPALYTESIFCSSLCCMGLPGPTDPLPVTAQIRSHHGGSPAVLSFRDETSAAVRFLTPVRAPAPGQSAVFYDAKGRILCGGVIQKEAEYR